jgi:hypothetical protein
VCCFFLAQHAFNSSRGHVVWPLLEFQQLFWQLLWQILNVPNGALGNHAFMVGFAASQLVES